MEAIPGFQSSGFRTSGGLSPCVQVDETSLSTTQADNVSQTSFYHLFQLPYAIGALPEPEKATFYISFDVR